MPAMMPSTSAKYVVQEWPPVFVPNRPREQMESKRVVSATNDVRAHVYIGSSKLNAVMLADQSW